MMLEIQNLKIQARTRNGEQEIVTGLTLSLAKGQITALVGESGSGKSTLALSVMRLLPKAFSITDGAILYDEPSAQKNVMAFSQKQLQDWRGQAVAMVFQDPLASLNPVMRVGEQIAEVLRAHTALNEAHVQKRVLEVLSEVGLMDASQRAQQYPHELSGGQRQRVMIAMALVCRPKILLADEPTTALDATLQLQILDLLQSLRTKYELTILLVTHDLALVKKYADFVYVMQAGAIVESGEPTTILQKPKNEYTQKLIAALPEHWQFSGPKIPMGKKVLSAVYDVGKSYPISKGFFWQKPQRVPVLQNINLTLYENEILGIVGESGSGKSTLGRLLAGVENPDRGQMLFDGVDLARATAGQKHLYRPRLQMIFQDPLSSLPPHRTVQQILEEPLRVHAFVPKPKITTRVSQVLTQVGLTADFLQKFPKQLSGGQAQRVAIARALLMQPKLLVADEATSALDVTVQKQVLELLRQLRDAQGLTIVFISHHPDVVAQFCDRVAVLYAGHVVEVLPATQMAQAQHPYTKSLMSSARFEHDKKLALFGETPSLLDLPTGCVLQNRCPLFEDVCETQSPSLLALPNAAHFCACHVVRNRADLKV